MKKVFVTVGTTSFDTLIQAVDKIALHYPNFEFIFQIANGSYVPENGYYLKYFDSIEQLYDSSDFVITHAGAGTIYKLLEMNKKIVVVPNLVRIDKHQSDIASYMEKNGHLLVAWTCGEIAAKIKNCLNYQPKPYQKTLFFKYKEIAELIEA